MILRLLLILLFASHAVVAQTKPATEESKSTIRYYTTSWSFDDVDVANLTGRLKHLGIKLPVSLRGDVSANITIGVPWGALRDPLAWQLDGGLSSRLLSIDDRTIHDLSAEVTYRQGVFTLDPVALFVPVDSRNVASRANTSKSGRLWGTARLDLRPGGTLTATLDMEDLPVQEIVEPYEFLEPAAGRVSGALQATVPVARLKIPSAWHVTGPVSADQLTLRGLPSVNGDLQFELKNSNAGITELQVDTGPLRLSGGGVAKLSNDGTWIAVAQVEADDLTDAEQQVIDFLPERIRKLVRDRVQGKVEVTTELKGTLVPFSVIGTGKLIASDLRVRVDDGPDAPGEESHVLRFSRIETDYDISQARLILRELKVEGPDINASGDATLNFDNELSWEYDGSLSIEQTDHTTATLPSILPRWWTETIAELSGAVTVSGRLRGSTTPATIVGRGTLHGTNNSLHFQEQFARPLALRNVTTESIEAGFDIDDEFVRLRNVRIRRAEGRIEASADIPLVDADAALSTSVSWENVRLGDLLSRWGNQSADSSGRIKFSAPRADLGDRTRWAASGELSLDAFIIGPTELRELKVSGLTLRDGQLRFDSFNANIGDKIINASGALEIVAPWNVESDLRATQLELRDILSLPQFDAISDSVSGTVSLDGRVRGTLSPLALTGAGHVAGRTLTWDELVVDDFQVAVEVDSESLRFSKIDAKLFSGRVNGNAGVPLSGSSPAELQLRLSGIDTAPLTKKRKLPFEPRGLVSGDIRVKAHPSDFRKPASWSIGLQLQIPAIQLNDLSIGDLTVQAEQENERVRFGATGTLFEGQITVNGDRQSPLVALSTNSPHSMSDQEETGIGNATVELRNAELKEVVQAFAGAASEQPLDGKLTVNLSVEENVDQTSWTGEIALADAKVGDVVLTDDLRGKIVGNRDRLRLEDLQGTVAGGRLAASIVVDPGDSQGLDARVSLRSARLERLKVLDPRTRNLPISGFADFEFSGRSGPNWNLRGLVTSGQGTFGKVRFNALRLPVTLTWTPESRRLSARTTAVSASVAGGTVSGRGTMELSRGLQVSAKGRFRNMQVSQISRLASSKSTSRRGRLDGTFSVSGRNVTAVDDLDASVRSEFRDTQAFGLPVLRGVPAFVPGVSSATSFREGRFDARLRNGLIDIQRLSLASPQVSVFVSGTYDPGRRLRLDAVVSTGSQADVAVARLLATRLLAATPAGWLLIANDYLSNRTIHIAVDGTLQRPILRLKPVESLQEEALAFFLRQTLGVPVSAPAAP